MEPKTLTTIDKLQVGDRFYKVSDKKKEVWQVVQGEVKTTKYQTYKYFAKRDNEKYATAINKNTQVVFLRHKST